MDCFLIIISNNDEIKSGLNAVFPFYNNENVVSQLNVTSESRDRI
jgi:hypothetical protein